MSATGAIKIKQRGKPSAAATATPANASPATGQAASNPAPNAAGGGGGGGAQAPRLKAVIRRLPASMTSDEFNILCADVITKENFEWSRFIPGKVPEEYVVFPDTFYFCENNVLICGCYMCCKLTSEPTHPSQP